MYDENDIFEHPASWIGSGRRVRNSWQLLYDNQRANSADITDAWNEFVFGAGGFTATAAQTLPKLSQSATATLTYSAAVAQTLPKLTQDAVANLPGSGFSATVEQTLPKLAQSATATLTFAATTAQTLPKLGQAATAVLTYSATVAQTLPRLAQSISATLTFSGSIAQTLPKLTQAAVADLAGAGFSATIEQTLPSLQQAAEATVTGATTETAPDSYWHVTPEEIERYWNPKKKAAPKKVEKRKQLLEQVKVFNGKLPSQEQIAQLAGVFFDNLDQRSVDVFAANTLIALERSLNSLIADLVAQQVAEEEARKLEAVWLIEDAMLRAFAQYEQMLEDDEMLAMFVM